MKRRSGFRSRTTWGSRRGRPQALDLGRGHRPGAHAGHGRAQHKTAQLCSQVQETLESVLAEQEDDILQGLHVVSVRPAPDDTQLMVTVAPGAGAVSDDPITILEHLNVVASEIRLEVAAAITRRRVPGLLYCVSPGPEFQPD